MIGPGGGRTPRASSHPAHPEPTKPQAASLDALLAVAPSAREVLASALSTTDTFRSDACASHRPGARSVVLPSLDRRGCVGQLASGLASAVVRGRNRVPDAGHASPQLQSSLILPCQEDRPRPGSAAGRRRHRERETTRSVLSRPSGIVSPSLQFGTAVLGVGGSAGVPSSCSTAGGMRQ
jgi:hypothetical protein